jgi:phage-related protein (TIGR01555 family)
VFNWIKNLYLLLKTKEESPAPVKEPEKSNFFDTNFNNNDKLEKLSNVIKSNFQKNASQFVVSPTGTMDSEIQPNNSIATFQNIPSSVFDWFGSMGFIGYQACAMIAQHWLVEKACAQAGEDALRKGYKVTVNDGEALSPEILDYIQQSDVRYDIHKNLFQFEKFGKVFGIRIAMFLVDSPDPDYYFKPFNIDGVTPGSYKGIVQIDPYWITPELDMDASGNPASKYYYEPTWWRISGVLKGNYGSRRIHRSHLVIMRGAEVADILKPTYFFGGVSLPQQIYEQVYAAVRTSNEAPNLAVTKRTKVYRTNLANAISNEAEFEKRLAMIVNYQNNYGFIIADLKDEIQFLDTTLADFEALIMTQYQLVSAIARTPAVKLLGTTPKGFNATGEYEEKSYHEYCESIQTTTYTPFLNRHYELLIRSEVIPKFNIPFFNFKIVWNKLAVLSEKEQAEVNKLNADTGAVLSGIGAIAAEDERNRIINDPNSNYSGLSTELSADELTEELELEPETE